MFRTFIVPLLAIAGVVLAVYTVVKGSMPPPAAAPVVEPPHAPYEAFVAGSGLVEPSSESIAIGCPVGAIVAEVGVKVGQAVKAGDVLFRLDGRELAAQLKVREAALRVASEQLARLEAGTRPELIPPAQAKLDEAEANLADMQALWDRAQQLSAGALSDEEKFRRQFATEVSRARVEQMRADLALLKAGTWSEDLDVSRAQVEQAGAQAEEVRVELERRTVRAPIDGVVLQVNVRAGEFAAAGALATPHLIMGRVTPLHVRVDVDEYEAWRVRAGSPAIAFARGNKDISTALTFVRFEPFVVPKKSLTGGSTERVDTRVLQVIFSFDPATAPLYVGQQVDAYIEAERAARAGRAGAAGTP